MRKLHTAALLLLIVSAISLFVWAIPEDPIKVYNKKIAFEKATRTVNVVDVDLKDKRVKVEAAVANDETRTVEELSSIVKRKNVAAAINANFFAAYSDFSPVGAIAHEGKYLWRTYYGTSVGISDDNEVVFKTNDFKGSAKLFINFVEQYDYTWYFDREDFKRDTIIFQRQREIPTELSKGVIITVKNGFISEVKYAPADIVVPEKGYVLCSFISGAYSNTFG